MQRVTDVGDLRLRLFFGAVELDDGVGGVLVVRDQPLQAGRVERADPVDAFDVLDPL